MAGIVVQRICRTGTIVMHAETGALGDVIDPCDGYRVRVHWRLNNRVVRTDIKALRVIAEPSGVFERMLEEACRS
jgi:hypothetical protein